jgi:hypothetical protein
MKGDPPKGRRGRGIMWGELCMEEVEILTTVGTKGSTKSARLSVSFKNRGLGAREEVASFSFSFPSKGGREEIFVSLRASLREELAHRRDPSAPTIRLKIPTKRPLYIKKLFGENSL